MSVQQKLRLLLMLCLALSIGTLIGSFRAQHSQHPVISEHLVNHNIEHRLTTNQSSPGTFKVGIKINDTSTEILTPIKNFTNQSSPGTLKVDTSTEKLTPLKNFTESRMTQASRTKENLDAKFHKEAFDLRSKHDKPQVDAAKRAGQFHTESFTLRDTAMAEYVEQFGRLQCFREGTNLAAMAGKEGGDECVCVSGWHGSQCSMPDLVFHSSYPYEYGIQLLDTPRRIIYAMPFNHEFDLLEAKLAELWNVVDVFLLLESNYTAAGTPRALLLRQRLTQGWLAPYQHKLFLVTLDWFPIEAQVDGWLADRLLRDYLGNSMRLLQGLRPDDIVVVNDADELPQRHTLLFLKLHLGYPEPIGFTLRHTVYGFYWRGEDSVSTVYGAASIGMLATVFQNSLYDIRGSKKQLPSSNHDLFIRQYGGRIQPWCFGNKESPAGWHCSWCFTAEGIRVKLQSAHVSDFPRYGQMQSKLSLNYIRRLVQSGTWFDDKTRFTAVNKTEKLYAPSFVLEHGSQYEYLLQRPP